MSTITYVQAVSDALKEELRRDEKVFLLGEDMGVYGGCFGVTRGFLDEFGPDRIMDTPISEGGFTGIAVGAAMAGYRPVVEYMFSDFVTCAMDLICNQAAKQRFMLGGQVKIPLVIRTPEGSGTGAAAQHSQSLEAWFCHVPGLKVVCPATPYDVKGLLKAAIREDNPIIFYEHKLLYGTKGEVPEEEYVLPIGKADVKREGKDITIISYSMTLLKALKAAEMLEADGIDAEVVDLRTVSPLDVETIVASAKKTGRVLVTHEGVQKFGVGAEVSSIINDSEAFFYLDRPVRRFGGADDIPIPYSPQLEAMVVPQAETIYEKAKELLK
ncbi:TPP-dependent acetoin dehydrogenase complex, E1 protein subunit beta [Christensenellaceae bacterium]|nr:TPP-dependent acetoin dehydrogenase complex, E1 protein subunit beta [Christensenellaceae bacterium]BDF60435.1 TPP-dependent acetoin dehydrogenase complex, E1 protein subunit beta [Christensenellaceae bacterium]